MNSTTRAVWGQIRCGTIFMYQPASPNDKTGIFGEIVQNNHPFARIASKTAYIHRRTKDMSGITFKEPQFVYRKDERTGEGVIFCTRPIRFKAYVFSTSENPRGFKLLPEKDTEQIRKIMKRMDEWYFKWHPFET